MKVTIHKSRDFILVWSKGNIEIYLSSSGNYKTAYNDLKDEDMRILKGLWNHLQSMKKEMKYAERKNGIEEVIKALDTIFEERKN